MFFRDSDLREVGATGTGRRHLSRSGIQEQQTNLTNKLQPCPSTWSLLVCRVKKGEFVLENL